MKKIVVLFLIISLVLSCSKEDDNLSKVIEVRINLSNTLDYQYSIGGNYKEDDIVEITTQASHFVISEIIVTENGYAFYTYKPQFGYLGTDYVEFTSEKIIDSESNQTQTNTYKFSFNILE